MTSYEDLPADLFGEEPGSASGPDDGRAAAPPAAGAAPAHSDAHATPAPPSPPDAPAGDPTDEDDPLATVGRLFPGRVIAVEPVEDDVDDGPEPRAAPAVPPVDDDGADDRD